MKKSAPLTKTEIRAGLARLMASPVMTSGEGRKGDPGEGADYTAALDAASDFRSGAGPDLFPFAAAWGMKGQVPGVIEELGVALLMHRLGVEELFRLGTSKEAVRLFEEYETRRVEFLKAYHAKKAADEATA